MTKSVMLLGALWFLVIFAPHWWLAAHGLSPLLRLPTLLFVLTMGVLALGTLTQPSWARRWQWYAPFLLFVLIGAAAIPFVVNNGLAREGLTQLFLYWVLIVATVTLVPNVKRTEQLLLMYSAQFVWWGVWGAQTGRVTWHPSWANFDGFGAMMVGGLGVCYFFAMARPKGWYRHVMYGAMILCAIGIVASFARGAFLGAVGLFGVIWLRSPRKVRTLGTGVTAAVVMLTAAAAFHPDTFWAEIRSTFEEGTTEGTGGDRWALWEAGFKVFQQQPVFGVGTNNFGPYAAGHFEYGEVGGLYANPGSLYNRALHSAYVQFLSERGIVGFGLFLWMLWDFFRRNAALRTEAAARRWREMGGEMELRSVALALEASMVAFLATAAVYSLITTPWFFTLLALNLVVHSHAVGKGSPAVRRGPGRAFKRARPGGRDALGGRVAVAQQGVR